MIIKIPLNTGLSTHAEPEDVGSGGNVRLTNYDIDIPGKLKRRELIGDTITSSAMTVYKGKSFVHRITTTDPYDTQTEIFIFIDENNQFIYKSNNSFGSVQSIYTIPSPYPTIINMFQDGGYLRFALGLTKLPLIYQYIDRNYFWNIYNPTTDYDMQLAYVRLDDTTINFISKIDNNTKDPSASLDDQYDMYGATTGLDLTNNNYSYKFAPIFDGLQEGLLSDEIASTLGLDSGVGTVVPKITLELDTNSFNKRLTALKLYRASSANNIYYNILNISTLANDPSLVHEHCLVQNFFYTKNYDFTVADSLTGRLFNTNLGGNNYVSTFIKKENFNSGNHNISTALEPLIFRDVAVQTDSNYNSIGVNASLATTISTYGTPTSNTIKADFTNPQFPHNQYYNSDWHLLNLNNLDPQIHDSFEDDDGNFSADGWSNLIQYSSTSSQVINPTKGGRTQDQYDNITTKTYTNLKPHSIYQFEVLISYLQTNTTNNATANRIITLAFDQETTSIEVFNEPPVMTGSTNNRYKVRFVFAFKTIQQSSIVIGIRPDYDNNDTVIDDAKLTHIAYVVAWNQTGLFGGHNLIHSPNFSLGGADSRKNSHVNIYDDNQTSLNANNYNPSTTANTKQYTVVNNTNNILKVVDPRFSSHSIPNSFATGTTFSAVYRKVHLAYNYLWSPVANTSKVNLDIIDTGLVEGATSRLEGVENIDVNYKYAVHLDGRLYVGHVRLDNDGEKEIHADWLLFSELNSPDVIPVSNYIQITDMQGGEITGLAKMLGDLVVFMNKGIFRISTPTSDPTGWSLIESEQNIGCVAPDSIIEVEGNVFFAGEDQIYALNQNFQAVPISFDIQDIWQSTSNKSSTRAIYDPKKRRIIYQFGSSTTNSHNYYFDTKSWSLYSFKNIQSTNYMIDSNMIVYVINKISNATNFFKLYDVAVSSETSNSPSKKTGNIALTDMGKTAIVRRINLQGHFIGNILIYVDDTNNYWDSGLVTMNSTKNNLHQSMKVGLRANSIALELVSNNIVSDKEIDINRIEIEVDDV